MINKILVNLIVLGGLMMDIAHSPCLATDQIIRIEEVTHEGQALALAPLYVNYYKRAQLNEATFLEKWRLANNDPNYHMLAAYHSDEKAPQGFISFSIVRGMYWEPAIGEFESVCVNNLSLEKEIADGLFNQALTIMKTHTVSKVTAVSCTNYAQELRLFKSYLPLDNDPSKTHFMLMMNK